MGVRRQLFHFEAPEDHGGGWQPTQEWGERIDSFIESAAPTLSALGSILQEPDPYADAGYQQAPQYQQSPPQYQQPHMPPQQQQALEQQAYQYQQQGYDPQQIQQLLQPMIQQALQEQIGPFMPMFGQIAEQQGEQVARQALTELQQEIGEFDQDEAILLAQAYLAQGMDPGQSLKAAANYVRERDQARETAAIEKYKASLMNAASARGDLGAGGAAVEGNSTPTGPGRYESAIQDWLSRSNPELPQ